MRGQELQEVHKLNNVAGSSSFFIWVNNQNWQSLTEVFQGLQNVGEVFISKEVVQGG